MNRCLQRSRETVGRPLRLSSLALALALSGQWIGLSVAQDMRPTPGATAALASDTIWNPEYGLAVGSWMIYPSLFAGAVFNDNVYQSSANRRSALGVRLRPSLQAHRDAGLHQTLLYLSADAQFYPGVSSRTALTPTPVWNAAPTNISARAGLLHVWAPTPDLKVSVSLDYSRQSGLFGTGFGASAPQIYVPTFAAIGVNRFTNQYSGTLAVEKNLSDRLFVRGAVGAQYIAYSGTQSNIYGALGASASDGLSTTASLRVGYWVTPQVYAFVEPSGDLRRYRNGRYDTNGYRVVAGLGSDLVSLFRGEIYGGYMRSMSVCCGLGAISSPAFGARIFYYPTQYLTFTASGDYSIAAAAPSYNNPWSGTAWGAGVWSTSLAANSGRTIQARLQADYAFSRFWTAYARVGYAQTRVSQANANSALWSAGAGLSYTFWRNLSATLEYQFSRATNSGGATSAWWGAASTNYAQSLVSAGLTYRY